MWPIQTKSYHPSWESIIDQGLSAMDEAYLAGLAQAPDAWLPRADAIFNAFSIPLTSTRVILMGESPYPRQQSANGYAFWDAATDAIWSDTGLAKPINRATSLRNFIKMLLVTEGLLSSCDTTQPAIAALPKQSLVQSTNELFNAMLGQGFLLLNASLVFRAGNVPADAKAWWPFMTTVLNELSHRKKPPTLLLLGNIAKKITRLECAQAFTQVVAEHPYNISFIQNPAVQHFFKPMHLLR